MGDLVLPDVARGVARDLALDEHAKLEDLLNATLRRGYAVNHGEWTREASFAAVAMPV
jgi:DNA-binding IclR family transcriptional regulator